MRVRRGNSSPLPMYYSDLDRESVYEVNAMGDGDPDWDDGLFILVDEGQIVDVMNHTIYDEENVVNWQFRPVDVTIVRE